jgi:hypothetical protein
MTEHLTDDQLIELLGQALSAAEPVPAHTMQAAYETMTAETFDAELARLVFDSATDELVGVRGAADATRQVTFSAPGVEIEIMVVSDGERRLIGQLVPPQTAIVELRLGDEVRETGTDNLGRFQFGTIPTGQIRLAITTQDGGRVVTEWMVV